MRDERETIVVVEWMSAHVSRRDMNDACHSTSRSCCSGHRDNHWCILLRGHHLVLLLHITDITHTSSTCQNTSSSCSSSHRDDHCLLLTGHHLVLLLHITVISQATTSYFFYTPQATTLYCSCLMSNWYHHLATSSKHNVVLDSAKWAHGMKTWRHLQNWKSITYHNTVRGGLSHCHRQHAKEIWWSSHAWFSSYVSRQTERDTYYNTSHPSQQQSNNIRCMFQLCYTNTDSVSPGVHQKGSWQCCAAWQWSVCPPSTTQARQLIHPPTTGR